MKPNELTPEKNHDQIEELICNGEHTNQTSCASYEIQAIKAHGGKPMGCTPPQTLWSWSWSLWDGQEPYPPIPRREGEHMVPGVLQHLNSGMSD